jgi:capsular polysaccharide biosynthesis protein/Mrp family chromosome partitioning ATPase
MNNGRDEVRSGPGHAPDADVLGILRDFRRKIWLLAAVLVVAGALAYVATVALVPTKYDATAVLLFKEPGNNTSPERAAATNVALTSLDAVFVETRKQLRTGLSLRELKNRISVQPRGQADVVDVTATAGSAGQAARMANTFADEFVVMRTEDARASLQNSIDRIDRELRAVSPDRPLYQDLLKRRDEFVASKIVTSGDAEVVNRALVPTAASAPRPGRNAVVAGFLGVVIAAAALAVRRRLRPELSPEGLEDAFGASLLARIPWRGHGEHDERRFLEAFRLLHTRLEAMQVPASTTRGVVIAIISPFPEDGRTTVMHHLGRATAATGASVLTVDLGARKPMALVSQTLADADAQPVRRDDAPVAYAHRRPQATGPNEAHVRAVRDALLHASRGQLEHYASEMRETADWTFVDAGASTANSYGLRLAGAVDGVLVVVDARRLPSDTLNDLGVQLRGVRANVVGVVCNRSPTAAPPNASRLLTRIRRRRHSLDRPERSPRTRAGRGAVADRGPAAAGAAGE